MPDPRRVQLDTPIRPARSDHGSRAERKIGARGLRMIIEDLMLDLKVTITREVVMAKDKRVTRGRGRSERSQHRVQ